MPDPIWIKFGSKIYKPEFKDEVLFISEIVYRFMIAITGFTAASKMSVIHISI